MGTEGSRLLVAVRPVFTGRLGSGGAAQPAHRTPKLSRLLQGGVRGADIIYKAALRPPHPARRAPGHHYSGLCPPGASPRDPATRPG